MLTITMGSISIETTVTCAVERSFGVLTRSIVMTVISVKSAFVDICTVCSIALITWVTRAVKGSNLVRTECILVTVVCVHRALIYICGKKS